MSAKPYADRLSCYHELGCLSRAAARAADVEALGEIVKDSLARNFFGTRLQMATDAEQRHREPPTRYGHGLRYLLDQQCRLRGHTVASRRSRIEEPHAEPDWAVFRCS
jgi:hypothetical protein